jgi:ferredoxin-NADP reductase
MAAARPRDCRARVVSVRPLAPEILEAELRLEDPARLAFEAGQWISVPFGPKIVRAYSIASPPHTPGRLTLAADVSPGGIGSIWFRELTPGTEVRFKGPLGGFVHPRTDARHPLLVAEEIGIVPIRSILCDLYERGFGRPVRLVYWARDREWLAYDGELRSLARRFPGFAYHPVVGTEGPGWGDARGGLVEAVERLAPSVEGLVALVAGGEQTIHRLRDLLVGKGLERRSFKWEKFW